jgi:hypothetical protein
MRNVFIQWLLLTRNAQEMRRETTQELFNKLKGCDWANVIFFWVKKFTTDVTVNCHNSHLLVWPSCG